MIRFRDIVNGIKGKTFDNDLRKYFIARYKSLIQSDYSKNFRDSQINYQKPYTFNLN